MKHLLPLCALSLLLTGCATSHRDVWAPSQPMYSTDPSATRRDLYSPAKPTGQYTKSIEDGSWKMYGKTADEDIKERREQQKFQQMLDRPVSAQPPAAAPLQ